MESLRAQTPVNQKKGSYLVPAALPCHWHTHSSPFMVAARDMSACLPFLGSVRESVFAQRLANGNSHRGTREISFIGVLPMATLRTARPSMLGPQQIPSPKTLFDEVVNKSGHPKSSAHCFATRDFESSHGTKPSHQKPLHPPIELEGHRMAKCEQIWQSASLPSIHIRSPELLQKGTERDFRIAAPCVPRPGSTQTHLGGSHGTERRLRRRL